METTPKEITLPIFIVDAFSNEPFKGNGAAVCLLTFQQVVPKSTRQKIAAEMNLSETVFISPIEENDTFQNGKRFNLQWFTPKCEVPLCGHATLASASVIFSVYNNHCPILEFQTASGILKAKQLPRGKIEIDLPAYESKPVDIKKYETAIKGTVHHLPVEEVVLSESGNMLIRLQDNVSRREIQDIHPNFADIVSGTSGIMGVIVTLKGSGADDCNDQEGIAYDFFSRYFAPCMGVLEDPVCGSAHSVLAPFWSKILNKTELYARQCSQRGGDLNVRLEGDRVALAGHSKVVVRGQINF